MAEISEWFSLFWYLDSGLKRIDRRRKKKREKKGLREREKWSLSQFHACDHEVRAELSRAENEAASSSVSV